MTKLARSSRANTCRPSYLPFFAAALLPFCAAPAQALVKFNDGRDEVFVTATAGIGYDSNLFATADSDGDTSLNASLLVEYQRRAGMLGVDASLGWDFSKYSTYSDEDFANPRFNGRLSKDGGRTTGSLAVNAQKENRADTAVNLRTESWNYGADLNVRYPVIERYSLSGNFGYGRQDFSENDVLVDISMYHAGADLLYALNSTRDLLVGYRYRTTDTTADTTDRDHAVTAGVSGKIIGKLNGSARFGFQNREVDRDVGPDSDHDSLTATLSTTWTLTSRFSLTGNVSKDFATIATDESVDTTTLSVDGQYAVNSRTAAFAGLSYTHLKFLDTVSGGRDDDGLAFTAGASYAFNERLRLSASYLYFQNWSTLPTADYTRQSVSLNVTTRW